MMKRIFFISVILLFSGLITKAQTNIASAQSMFIYNFSRLIEWPVSYKSGPFIIATMGSGLTSELNNYTKGKRVGSQVIEVKQFKNPEDITKCHILFVPFSRTKQMNEILTKLSGQNTLIIAEKNGAIDEGAAINFVIVGDKLKFELKPENASKYGIKLSSKLTEMAYHTY
jgi:hypothetical protein